ncbi:MAG: hypothetical protein ACHQC9_06745, partial [Alphaproteobacteria bacterium]
MSIANTITQGITLSNSGTYASPLTITSTGYIDNTGTGSGIYGPNNSAWTVVNQGTVTATAGDGVDLALGGSVDNAGTGGLIQGYGGIVIKGAAGTVTNSATIIGTGTTTSAAGVYLSAGGS